MLPMLTNFTLQKQSLANLCWAACVASAASWLRQRPVAECEVVDRTLHASPSCCGQSLSYHAYSPCNNRQVVSDALKAVGHYGGDHYGWPSLLELQNQDALQRPVVLVVQWLDGGSAVAHAMVLAGVDQSAGVPTLRLLDPNPRAVAPPIAPMSYADVQTYLPAIGAYTVLTSP